MPEMKPIWLEVAQTLITPLVIAGVGWFIQDAIKQKEINGRMLELSVQILSEKPTKEKMVIREWAVNTLNEFSKVKLDKNASDLLIYNAIFINEMWDDTEMWDDAIMGGAPQFIGPLQPTPAENK